MTFYNLNMLANVAVLVFEQEQRAKKGKSKITYEDKEEKSLLEEIRKTCFFPEEKRSKVTTRRNPKNPFRYFSGASSSASSSSSSSPKLFDLKCKADSVTLNPQNPNSRKRRDVQEKRAGGFKKKRDLSYSWKGKAPPEWLAQAMRKMNVDEDPSLIFETTLSKADVTPGQSRLLIPFNKLQTNDFLTPVESNHVKGQGGGGNNDDDDGMKPGVGAVLVDQSSIKFGVIFKFWEMKKESGKGSSNYIFNCGWNDVVSANKLEEGQTISIWSFRYRSVLCFALVPPP